MAYQKNNFAGVPFKTLLDKGHKQYNLAGVETEILQFPCAENGNMAVFRAVVKNTTSTIAPHLLRMAETRAIARALRWLTNSGETAHVEISGDEDESRTQQMGPGRLPSDEKYEDFIRACGKMIVEHSSQDSSILQYPHAWNRTGPNRFEEEIFKKYPWYKRTIKDTPMDLDIMYKVHSEISQLAEKIEAELDELDDEAEIEAEEIEAEEIEADIKLAAT